MLKQKSLARLDLHWPPRGGRPHGMHFLNPGQKLALSARQMDAGWGWLLMLEIRRRRRRNRRSRNSLWPSFTSIQFAYFYARIHKYEKLRVGYAGGSGGSKWLFRFVRRAKKLEAMMSGPIEWKTAFAFWGSRCGWGQEGGWDGPTVSSHKFLLLLFFFLWCAGNLAGADANFGRGWKILGARTSVNVVSRGSKRHKFLVSEGLGKKREHYSLLRASFWRENFPKVWEEVG